MQYRASSPPAGPSRRQLLAAAAAALPAFGRCAQRRVPVLVYHRFAPTALDGMTVRLDTFDAQLAVLRELKCEVVPMERFLAWHAGSAALPPRAVVLTADDAHRSQYEHMAPRLAAEGWPVTLFVYPSAVSNASYAMRWEQLAELGERGGFRIESHTYWHPNFAVERRRLAPAAFERFAREQLARSHEALRAHLGVQATLLAWPFGIADDTVATIARESGYRAAFALGNKSVSAADPVFDLPRHLVTEAMQPRVLRRLLAAAFG